MRRTLASARTAASSSSCRHLKVQLMSLKSNGGPHRPPFFCFRPLHTAGGRAGLSTPGLTAPKYHLIFPYFQIYRNTELGGGMSSASEHKQIVDLAGMLAALGTESRLRIMRLLLSSHPDGLIVGEIGAELGIPASTLSHHLDKLKNHDLVVVRRESTFLRYSANAATLQKILSFLFAECCTRNKAVNPKSVTCC